MRRVGIVAGFESRQVIEGKRIEVQSARCWLVDHDSERNHGCPSRLEQRFHFAELASRAQNIIHKHNLLARALLQVLPEPKLLVLAGLFGPIDLSRSQSLADSVGYGETGSGGSNDRELRDNCANLGIGAQEPAQTH